MEMKYYNPSNNFRAPIPRQRKEPKPYIPPAEQEKPLEFIPEQGVPEHQSAPVYEEKKPCVQSKKLNVLGELSQDEIMILGIIFILIINSCDDYLLLLALGYLFISGRSIKQP